MLMFAISIFGGMILGKLLRNIFALAFASFIFSFISSAITYEMTGIDIPDDATVVVNNFIIFPIITFISALFSRKAVPQKAKQSTNLPPPPRAEAQVEAQTEAQAIIPASRDYISSDDEEQAWAVAHNEFTNNIINEGLWAKCFYSCDQNEHEAQKLYVETRVEELLSILEQERISDARKAKTEREWQVKEQIREGQRQFSKFWILVVGIGVFIVGLLLLVGAAKKFYEDNGSFLLFQ
jgi:hypothetical protein